MPSNKGVTNVKYVGIIPKVTSKFNIPGITHLEYFYLGIQVGSRGMNNMFGLPQAFVTWDSKLTSTQRPLWSHGGAEHLKVMTAL